MPVETTDQYVRVRVRQPDDFIEKSFRTIWISKEKKIKAVAGRLKTTGKMTVQSYLFDKDEWTEKEAIAWVREYGEEPKGRSVDMEQKRFTIKDVKCREEKQADGSQVGIIEGYASVFGTIDSYNDIVWPGAFKKTLSEHPTFPFRDEHSDTIGVFHGEEDAHGLFVHAEVNLDVQRGRESYALAKQGAKREFSIGYKAIKWDMGEDNIRNLREVKLYEVSLVTFAANEDAVVTYVKNEPSLDDASRSTPVSRSTDTEESKSESDWARVYVELKEIHKEIK